MCVCDNGGGRGRGVAYVCFVLHRSKILLRGVTDVPTAKNLRKCRFLDIERHGGRTCVALIGRIER